MLQELLHKWKFNNKFNTIELIGDANNSSYKLLKGSFKDDKFSIEDYQENIDISKVFDKDKKTFSTFLNINNNKVLNKIVDTDRVSDVKSIFPNFKVDDFFIQTSIDFNGESIISLIRKDDLESIISDFNSEGINIIGISLGVVSSPLLFQQFDVIPNTIHTDIFDFNFTENQLVSITKTLEDSVHEYSEIDNITSGQFNLYSLIATANYLNDTLNIPDCKKLNNSNKEFIWGRIFKSGLQVGLLSMLIILLANYLFFDFYYKKQIELEQNLQVQSVDNDSYHKIKNELQNKINFIEQQNLSDNTKASYYLDIIASNIPNSILLESIEYFPIKKKIKADKEVINYKNIINLEGESVNKIGFIKWIEDIKNISWIEKLDVIDYDISDNGRMKFNIHIKMDISE